MTDALDELAEYLRWEARDSRDLAAKGGWLAQDHEEDARRRDRWLSALERARQNERRYLWIKAHEYSSGHIESISPVECMDCRGFDTPQVHGAHSPIDTAIDTALAQQEAP